MREWPADSQQLQRDVEHKNGGGGFYCVEISNASDLTCVCADVATQQPRPGESLSTGGANAGQGVWADVHLQSAQAGVLFGTVFAKESGSGCRDVGLSLFLLWGIDMSHDTSTFHPLSRGVCVHRFRAGRVWGASFILLPTAAGTATEAAWGAEVQGGWGCRELWFRGGQVEGRDDTQVPQETCGEAGGRAVCWWKLGNRIPLGWRVWKRGGQSVATVSSWINIKSTYLNLNFEIIQ